MGRVKFITLIACRLSRYKNRDGNVLCAGECGHEFKEDERAFSKYKGSDKGLRKVLYCPKCAWDLFWAKDEVLVAQ